ncbi:hypothetical protein CYMTET_50757 [Cymbomonas tetramitiformis]|uniref:Uncharacterized protein n=1 Tax=Cymbomonas tetramitiformis TaxID=36881 RepID=A0AAE0EUF8_9CHLO|nr:hypothetical protein CYMTET_50757 [Cymbomonas tetramitiformis]
MPAAASRRYARSAKNDPALLTAPRLVRVRDADAASRALQDARNDPALYGLAARDVPREDAGRGKVPAFCEIRRNDTCTYGARVMFRVRDADSGKVPGLSAGREKRRRSSAHFA